MKEPIKWEPWEKWMNLGLVLLVIGAIIGIRYVWAKFVYNDVRCMWAECRILK